MEAEQHFREEGSRQEEVAVVTGTLSEIEAQLDRAAGTAQERSEVFRDEADRSDVRGTRYRTAAHLLSEIQSDVREIQEHIDRLKKFLRTGALDGPDGPTPQKNVGKRGEDQQ